MFNWKCIFLFFSVTLLGCSSNTEPISTQKIITVELAEPNWPTPIASCKVKNIKIIEYNGVAMIAIPWNDYISKSQCEQQKVKYLKDLTEMVCFYRTNDVRCKIE